MKTNEQLKKQKVLFIGWIITIIAINYCLFNIYSIFLGDLGSILFNFNLHSAKIPFNFEPIIALIYSIGLVVAYFIFKLFFWFIKRKLDLDCTGKLKKAGKFLAVLNIATAIIIFIGYSAINLSIQNKELENFIKNTNPNYSQNQFNDGLVSFSLPEGYFSINEPEIYLSGSSNKHQYFTNEKYLISISKTGYHAPCVKSEKNGVSVNNQYQDKNNLTYPFRVSKLENGVYYCTGYTITSTNISGWNNLTNDDKNPVKLITSTINVSTE